MLKRGFFLKTAIVLLAIFVSLSAAGAQASDFPSKPIQIIVAWSAGASEDMRARALAPGLEKALGQPVVVVNKPGAAGTLGMTLTAKSKPDGYTLVSSSASPVIAAPFLQKVEYNPLTDFTFVAGTAIQPYGMCVRADAPWKNLNEVIQYVKDNPSKLKFGSTGIGGINHIYMEMFGKAKGLNWVHVPFKGDQPQITALLGGHIPVASTSSAFAPHVRSGKMRLLAILGEKRIAAFPDVPALKEFGVDIDLRGGEVLGFAGPKGLPPEVVAKLEKAFKYAVETPENKTVMEQLANEANFRDSQTFTKLIKELNVRTGEMIKELGITQQ
jgi:tripartite-type tricarboxylate transporter receptor subunit TctC